MRLTPHFDTREFNCRSGRPLPPSSYRQVTRLCEEFLEPLRDRFGPVVVISGYRTRAWNRKVGGAKDSYHVYRAGRWGVAADVHCLNGQPADWYEFLDELGAHGLGKYFAHVHVDNRAGHARW